MHDAEAMVRAHRAGCKLAQNANATLRLATDIAQRDYGTYDEQDAYVAGYLGTLKRMGVERSQA